MHTHTMTHPSTSRTPATARPDIPGWGSDLERGKRPAFAMEVEPHTHDDAEAPEQQRRNMEVLVSNERPSITPLFGTGPEPTGISGAIRRYAFTFSENDIRHFMLLLLADRVNVVEGLGDDLSKGEFPNVLAEMGIKAEWEHNRAGLIRKVAIAGAITGLALYALNRRRD